MIIDQNKNFLLGIFATVAKTASKARISSADTTFPLRFNNSIFDSLNACAKVWSSSIIKRLFDRSKSLKDVPLD